MAAQEIAARASQAGVEMLDVPVSGGEPKAIEGTLAFMVGGKESVFDQMKDVLATMGASVTHVGAIGSGNLTKLANQIIVALNIAAVSEALVLAVKAGVDPDKVYRAIRGGLAGSTVLDAKAPLMMQGNFKPGFRIGLHIKDLQNALDTAHELGAPIPLCSQIMEIMQALRTDGKAGTITAGSCSSMSGSPACKSEPRRRREKESRPASCLLSALIVARHRRAGVVGQVKHPAARLAEAWMRHADPACTFNGT